MCTSETNEFSQQTATRSPNPLRLPFETPQDKDELICIFLGKNDQFQCLNLQYTIPHNATDRDGAIGILRGVKRDGKHQSSTLERDTIYDFPTRGKRMRDIHGYISAREIQYITFPAGETRIEHTHLYVSATEMHHMIFL